MAKLYVTEFSDTDHGVGKEPALAEQAFAFTTTTQSAAFHALTRVIRVHTDAICSIAIGINPVATADTRRMAAGDTAYFAVESGFKVAAVTNT